jgi:hypothetical protein
LSRGAAALLLLVLAGCGRAPEEARFAPEDCRRVAVRAADGRPLVGVEDLGLRA